MRLSGIFFLEPYRLLALTVVPVFILLFLNMFRWIRARLAKFGEKALISRITPENSVRKQYLKFLFMLFAFICIILELSKPRITYRKELSRPADVLIVMDVSRSMLAKDALPTRLQKVKNKVRQYLDQLQDIRVGLIPFAGQSLLQVPLTSDKKTLLHFMEATIPETIPVQGTEIAPALRMATTSFSGDSARTKFIMLFTDGENHEPDAIAAAHDAYKSHIHLLIFGVGSKAGSPVPVYQNGRFTGYKTDRNGKEVISRYNPRLLDSMAEAGHGSFFSLDETDLQDPLNKMSRLIDTSRRAYREEVKEVDFPIFMTLAFLFLLADFVLSEKKKTWFTDFLFQIRKKKVLTLFVFFSLGGICSAQAQVSLQAARHGNELYHQGKYAEAEGYYRKNLQSADTPPGLLFNLASTLFKEEKYQESADFFALVLKDSTAHTLKASSYYGLGNALLKQRKFEESIDMYIHSLRIKPNDKDVLYNLAYARFMLKKKTPPPPPSSGYVEPPPLVQQQEQKKRQKEPPKSDLKKSEEKNGAANEDLPQDW